MSFIADRVYQTATNPGSGAVTPNASVTGYATFSSGVPTGSTLTIAIENQTPGEWEICDAVWNGTTLTRGPLLSSSTGSRVTFTGPVNVFSTASAKYINTPAGYADNLGFKSNSSTAIATTGASGTAGTATITFATQGSAPYAIGSFIGITGVTPSGYNGLYQVTGCTTSSVSFANATTAAQTVAGLITQTNVLTNASSFYQYVTSTSTQSSFVLPDTSTLQQGWSFRINNGSSGSSCTVYTSTGSGTTTIVPGTTYYFTCIDTTVNTASAWRVGITETPTATGTGNMVLSSNPTISGSLNFTDISINNANFATSTTTANQVLVTFDATLYRTIKLTVQAADGTNYQSTELLAVHNGITANHTEYGTVTVGSACASYTIDYSGDTVRLLATPASATATTYKIAAYLTRV